jgi:aspartate/methionine/tyrosine aminotransferase
MEYKRSQMVKEAPEEVGLPIIHGFSESGVTPRTLKDLDITIPADLPLAHTKHQGRDRLCSLVADACNLNASDVLITVGASSALFIAASALLKKSDHLIITRPNYPANIETPELIGCDISFIDLDFDAGFELDIDRIAAEIRRDTRLISITNPNNPTGTSLTEHELQALAELARRQGCYLLVDETYADLAYTTRLPGAASLGDHVIGISSMSKAYGVPGLRIGWITSRNKKLQETFLAAKELLNISVSVLDEYVAEQILERRHDLLRPVRYELQRRRDIVDAWVQSEDRISWVRPDAGAIGLIRIKQEPFGGIPAFYDRLLRDHGTYIGPGRWFGQPDTFFRLGFGYPSAESLKQGLAAISEELRR